MVRLPTSSRRSMTFVAFICMLALVGCGAPQPTATEDAAMGREHITPADFGKPGEGIESDPASRADQVEGIPTVLPAIMYDPDGDGFMDTETLIQAVEDSWKGYAFPPGYQFAIERFRTEFSSRAETEGDERWQLRYNNTIISISQTCAWIDYWMANYSAEGGASQDTHRMFTEVFPQNFIFVDMLDLLDQLAKAVLLGDVGTVNQISTGMHCDAAYYRPDWSGPSNLVPINRYAAATLSRARR